MQYKMNQHCVVVVVIANIIIMIIYLFVTRWGYIL